MSGKPDPKREHPVRFTEAQRKVVAEIMPVFSARLKLDEQDQRVVSFTRDELNAILQQANRFIWLVDTGMKRNSLRHVVAATRQAIEDSQGFRVIPATVRIYQFKVTLLNTRPPIWRRFQTRDCTLDRLHVQIQTAMGWTNSHLHHFTIDEQFYGDPMLMEEDFEGLNYADSTTTKVSAVLPRSGKPFRFKYEYDFGDSWDHEVLFEGCLRAEPGQRYPHCLEGSRSCPPEDVGGTAGYAEFLEVIADPEDDQHDQFLTWIGGKFDAESFEPVSATKKMRRGLPNWRKMES